MHAISGHDAYLLHDELPEVFLHTLKVAIIDPASAQQRISFDRFKQLAEERLPLLLPFRCKPIAAPFPFGVPVWIEEGSFDTDYHIKHIILNPDDESQTLNDLMGQVMSEPLSRDRPLWQLYYIEGLAQGHIGFVLKIHHAVADGGAVAAMVNGILQDKEGPLSKLPQSKELAQLYKIEARPKQVKLVLFSLMHTLWAVLRFPSILYRSIREIIIFIFYRFTGAPKTISAFASKDTRFNNYPTTNRIVAHTCLPMHDLRKIKKAFGCTINDVYLCLTGGALHHYLKARGELPEKPLSAVIPVSIRQPGEDITFGNAVSQLFASTESHIADPSERLLNVCESTKAARKNFAKADPLLSREWYKLWFLRQLYFVTLPAFMTAIMKRPSYHLIASNVRGPEHQLYIDGAPIIAIRSVGPITRQQGLNVTAWSYMDQFSISLQSCKEYAADLDQLAAYFDPELKALLKAASALDLSKSKDTN